jgi:NADH dehydrogenase
VGILKGDFTAFHVDGARHIATAAADAGIAAMVQMSAIGADPASASAYGRSKGEGEAVVRAAFPAATILRPSIVFGREDQFINRFAGLISTAPVMPVVRAAARFQPVYVADVAAATLAVLDDPAAGHAARTYELGGPDILSMGALIRWIAAATGRTPIMIDLPDSLSALIARAGFLPGAPITWDQWLMLQSDNVVTGTDGLESLGIVPTPIAAVAPGWLVKYRRHGRFGAISAA